MIPILILVCSVYSGIKITFFWHIYRFMLSPEHSPFTNLLMFCRLHISFLRQARQTEVSAVKLLGNKSGSGHSNQEKYSSKNINFHTHKQALDKRFNSLTNRIKQLPGINKHIHFDSTDDETEGDTSSEDDKFYDNESKNGRPVLDKKDVDPRVNSCPYPSKTEEMERLGLISETNKKPALESSKARGSGKKGNLREKRKFEENGTPSSSCKQPKKQKKLQKHEASPNCFLSIGKLENFITTWKETCREHPVQQVRLVLAIKSIFSLNNLNNLVHIHGEIYPPFCQLI